ncbi:DUF998 domain-containing protein [Actinomadura sp. 9N407]|uniref:DUF998 domain-containing protein n=1 Tax=Actinomadura sp. 9N407 TaxID=3375154 RepID=UPI0037BCBC79
MDSHGTNVATRALLACGVVAGPLFTAAYLIEGATRAGYSTLRHPVSSLALGEYGWTQTANFLVAGVLVVAFAAGVWRAAPRPVGGPFWGPALIGLWGAGLLGAGAFRADPVSGYPSGTPDLLEEYTTLGALHDGVSIIGFLGMAAVCFVFTRRFARVRSTGRAVLSATAGLLFLVLMELSNVAFSQNEALVDHGGLLQRGAVTVVWVWMAWLALHLLRNATASGHRKEHATADS